MTGSASLTIEYVNLEIDSACSVYIGSFSDPICSSQPMATTPTDTGNNERGTYTSITDIIGPLIGTVFAAVIIVLVVICALHIFKNRRQLIKFVTRLVQN